MQNMTIEVRPAATLRPYARNARTHSKKQIRQIANSIERFGFTNPVLISDDNEIIAGHGRVEAAKLLGIKEVPTVRLSHLNEAQRRAYVLADNKLALNAGWDREMLGIELQTLIDLEFDIEITGFSLAEVDLVIEEAKESSPGGPSEGKIKWCRSAIRERPLPDGATSGSLIVTGSSAATPGMARASRN
jgi:ParB-like chromosome segregation protein Spo0J